MLIVEGSGGPCYVVSVTQGLVLEVEDFFKSIATYTKRLPRPSNESLVPLYDNQS